MESRKKIIIVAGVTGAIGSALFTEYAQDTNAVVYGISRKAVSFEKFLKNGKLPSKTLICSVPVSGDLSPLFRHIPYDQADEVIYIHALGLYPFEVNAAGEVVVENDGDHDGINDEVTRLTYNAFVLATQSLAEHWSGKTTCALFGGIVDKHRPAVHHSWWKTVEKVKEYVLGEIMHRPNLSVLLFNISSVLCPHEVITRPFVFTSTDADPSYWLHPYELAKFVVASVSHATPGFSEIEKFNKRPGFSPDTYYHDSEFTPRKMQELY